MPISTKRAKYSDRLAARLRELRVARGLSVAELAAAVGLAAVTIYKYESGENQIDANFYPALAAALGVSASRFLPSFSRSKAIPPRRKSRS